jgi:transposase InsO family protein
MVSTPWLDLRFIVYQTVGLKSGEYYTQYTSFAWGNFMEKQGIKISMDGKGRATDNAWIERFWRTIKKDHLYLNPAETGTELYQQVEYFVNYYNNRHHQGIKDKPNNLYTSNSIPLNKAS